MIEVFAPILLVTTILWVAILIYYSVTLNCEYCYFQVQKLLGVPIIYAWNDNDSFYTLKWDKASYRYPRIQKEVLIILGPNKLKNRGIEYNYKKVDSIGDV